MPRFVILQHDYPELHWDLMLEAGEVLRTWRLAGPPCPDHAVSVQASFDHRLFYLNYEGPLSGGRGNVVRWDEGEFAWLKQEAGEVSVLLTGKLLRGVLFLRLTAGNGTGRFEPTSS